MCAAKGFATHQDEKWRDSHGPSSGLASLGLKRLMPPQVGHRLQLDPDLSDILQSGDNNVKCVNSDLQ